MTKTEHQRFVQSVRYSPNGDHFATGGFDGKIFVYDGKTSDLIGELGTKSRNLFHHRNFNIIQNI
jgi:WD40 repeat protein